MNIQINTLFDQGDAVESKVYGPGVITCVSVRLLILPNDEREKDINYHVCFSTQEMVVNQAKLRRQNTTNSEESKN